VWENFIQALAIGLAIHLDNQCRFDVAVVLGSSLLSGRLHQIRLSIGSLLLLPPSLLLTPRAGVVGNSGLWWVGLVFSDVLSKRPNETLVSSRVGSCDLVHVAMAFATEIFFRRYCI